MELTHKIRQFDKSDTHRILQLEYTRYDEPLSRSLFNFLVKKYGTEWFYVLDVTGDGLIDAYVLAGIEKDDWVHILSIVVLEDLEGQGIAQFMIHYLEQLAKGKHQGLRLEVNVKNDHAKRLYTKIGFKQIGYFENYYDRGENALLMEMKFE